MSRDGRMRLTMRFASCLGWCVWTTAALGSPHQPPHQGVRGAFNLAVDTIEVTQVSSTPMFREIEVHCVVVNRGPKASSGPVTVVVSRAGDDGAKVLKKSILEKSLAPGATYDVRAQGSAWFASAVPYSCELQFGGNLGGDADASDDYREATYPKL